MLKESGLLPEVLLLRRQKNKESWVTVRERTICNLTFWGSRSLKTSGSKAPCTHPLSPPLFHLPSCCFCIHHHCLLSLFLSFLSVPMGIPTVTTEADAAVKSETEALVFWSCSSSFSVRESTKRAKRAENKMLTSALLEAKSLLPDLKSSLLCVVCSLLWFLSLSKTHSMCFSASPFFSCDPLSCSVMNQNPQSGNTHSWPSSFLSCLGKKKQAYTRKVGSFQKKKCRFKASNW